MKKLDAKQQRLKKRKMRIRRKIQGTATRPRLSVHKSNRYLYIQAVDDTTGNTVASLWSNSAEAGNLKLGVENAGKFGEIFGKKLQEQNIAEAVFDRNGNLFHGVVKAVADGTRKAGIKF